MIWTAHGCRVLTIILCYCSLGPMRCYNHFLDVTRLSWMLAGFFNILLLVLMETLSSLDAALFLKRLDVYNCWTMIAYCRRSRGLKDFEA